MTTILNGLVVPGEHEILEDRIGVKFDGRWYGDTAFLNEVFEQPLPPVFIPIAEEIQSQSQLLKLDGVREKEDIFAAYRVDLALLNKYMSEFEHAVRQAVRCSIITWNQDDLPLDEQWAGLKEQIPPIGNAALLALSSTRAAKPVPELLEELKQEFNWGVRHLMKRMAFWLQLLVEEEFVGLIEWAGDDACAYHYFLYERQERVLAQEKRREVSQDPSKPFGQRITTEEIEERTVQRRQFEERHVHHIVNIHVWELPEFPEMVPERVRVFLDVMPEWLQPHVRIVSGDITMVEQLRKETSTVTTREEEVVSVWKRSPALVLGSFVLLGWSADDLKNGAGFARVQQAASVVPHPFQEKITVGMVLGILSVLALAVIAGGLVGPVGAALIAVIGMAIVLAIATRNNKTPRGDMIKVDPKE